MAKNDKQNILHFNVDKTFIKKRLTVRVGDRICINNITNYLDTQQRICRNTNGFY
jgi:hypothetical protein